MRVRHVFGPHPCTKTGSYIVVIDTVGFPKKCVYDCIYCPVGPSNTRALQPASLIPPENIASDLTWLLERIKGNIDALLFYGTGDPWLNPWLPIILERVEGVVKEHGYDVEVYAVTTGHLLARQWAIQALNSMDRVYVKIDGFSAEDYSIINNPHPNAKMKNVVEAMKKISSIIPRDKIFYEVTLIEYEGVSNAKIDSLDQIAAFLSMVKAENVFLRTIRRPPRVQGVKPVSKKKLEFARKFFEDKGYSVCVEENVAGPYGGSVVFHEEMLYNHLLRRPLTLQEIMFSYNITVATAAGLLKSLEKKGLIVKKPWRTQVFYKGVISGKSVLGQRLM